MFAESLSNRLQKSIEKKLNKTKITPEILDEVLREIRLALLEGDVNFRVVKAIILNIKTKWENGFATENLSPKQTLIKYLHDEIINILGGETYQLKFNSDLTTIILAGLQGSGKTTTVAKLANRFKKSYDKKILLIAADLVRPAAIKQLEILGNQIGVKVYTEQSRDSIKVVKNGLSFAKENNFDTVIIDTAGRLHVDDKLMKELLEVQKVANPTYTLLAIDAQIGQDAVNVVKSFNETIKISGMIITKLDSDTRAGAALSVTYLTKLPIFFAGTGEAINQIEVFHPDRIADRIMGMGDVQTLLEVANENLDQRSAQKTFNRLIQGKFDLYDLLTQMEQIQKMGKFSKIMSMMPKLKTMKVSSDKMDEAEEKLYVYKILMSSMTKKELREPRLLKQLSRKERILKGSGRSIKEFNELINRYEQLKKSILKWSKDIKNGKMGSLPSFM